MSTLRRLAAAPPVIVAIPARNEAARIGACLRAIGRGTVRPDAIVVLMNNCTDGSARAVGDAAAELAVPVVARAVTLDRGRAHAGWARRLAMEHAARLAGADGVLLCTDADGVPDADWVAANLRALAAGADAVAGMAEIDPDEALLIPAALHEADALECAYAAQLDRIDWLTDPDPCDPWPRHDQHSGASIAVTASAYRAVGGISPIPLGEDRALFDALRRIDARIRHAPDAIVTVSGRTDGRARGGMADTIRRRLVCPDAMLDPRLEPARDAHARVLRRRLARLAWRADRGPFGAAWADMDAAFPRRPVPVRDLPRQAASAAEIIGALSRTADRADTPPFATQQPA